MGGGGGGGNKLDSIGNGGGGGRFVKDRGKMVPLLGAPVVVGGGGGSSTCIFIDDTVVVGGEFNDDGNPGTVDDKDNDAPWDDECTVKSSEYSVLFDNNESFGGSG